MVLSYLHTDFQANLQVAEQCESLAQLPTSGLPVMLQQNADSTMGRAAVNQVSDKAHLSDATAPDVTCVPTVPA